MEVSNSLEICGEMREDTAAILFSKGDSIPKVEVALPKAYLENPTSSMSATMCVVLAEALINPETRDKIMNIAAQYALERMEVKGSA